MFLLLNAAVFCRTLHHKTKYTLEKSVNWRSLFFFFFIAFLSLKYKIFRFGLSIFSKNTDNLPIYRKNYPKFYMIIFVKSQLYLGNCANCYFFVSEAEFLRMSFSSENTTKSRPEILQSKHGNFFKYRKFFWLLATAFCVFWRFYFLKGKSFMYHQKNLTC